MTLGREDVSVARTNGGAPGGVHEHQVEAREQIAAMRKQPWRQ
jgi:hypothetical protein